MKVEDCKMNELVVEGEQQEWEWGKRRQWGKYTQTIY